MTRLEKEILKNKKLKKRLEEERERATAYTQIVKLYSAYMAMLLLGLGATRENPFKIVKTDISKALAEFEARAIPNSEGFQMYVEVIGDEHNISAETSEATGTETDKS